MRRSILVLLLVLVSGVSSALAQSLEVSAHLASSQWSEFDGTDIGGGARLTFKPAPMLGIEGDVTWYPGDFPPDGVPFSGNRLEGLFGVTAGPRLAGFRPFAKIAGGFMKVSGSPDPFACITIFPPPLSCLMAGGETMAAFEFGGGVELLPTGHALLRIDVTDRMLKYPGPTFDAADRAVNEEGFFGHALKFTIGAGWRF